MTNICQAIEEELMAIQFAEDSGQNIYDKLGRPTGMNVALWREILSNPETMRIEVTKDFAYTSADLLRNIIKENTSKSLGNLQGMATVDGFGVPKMQATYNIDGPIIIYIPDYFSGSDETDGVFVLHWLEKSRELNDGNACGAWSQVKRKYSVACFDNYIPPISIDDTGDSYWTNLAKSKDIQSLQSMCIFLNTALAAVDYIMKKPNFATQTIVSNSGGVRKRLEKKKGIPRDRWSRIQWNVGQNVQREVRKTMGEEHCTALHRVRGFYRKAESHYNNVTKIEGNWFQWIKPFWRGHPAFGIIKSTYAPKIEDIKLQ